LNGAKRLNGWNDWNALTNAKRLQRLERPKTISPLSAELFVDINGDAWRRRRVENKLFTGKSEQRAEHNQKLSVSA
jgi:hypothetical protein